MVSQKVDVVFPKSIEYFEEKVRVENLWGQKKFYLIIIDARMIQTTYYDLFIFFIYIFTTNLRRLARDGDRTRDLSNTSLTLSR